MTLPQLALEPIGVLRTPHREVEGSPIQPSGARGLPGRAELWPELEPGLKDLEGFSHLILIYQFHLAGPSRLRVRPFLDAEERGVFATRAPVRPNPIGFSVVRLERIEGTVLHLLDVDMTDRSPLLDLKPLVPEFDTPWGEVRTGWLEARAAKAEHTLSDDRF